MAWLIIMGGPSPHLTVTTMPVVVTVLSNSVERGGTQIAFVPTLTESTLAILHTPTLDSLGMMGPAGSITLTLQ